MKHILLCSFAALLLLAFTRQSDRNDQMQTIAETVDPEGVKEGSVMLFVRVKTSLEEAELLRIAHERAPQFASLPGLIQKYYVRLGNPGEYGGVYIWDNAESLTSYRKSELAATIAQAYKATEPPTIEVLDMLFQLRE